MKTITSKKYVILFISLLLLCWLFPYTGDDWAWGSSIGLARLSNFFEGYSGRYLGNFIVLILTRSNAVKTVVMAVTITVIIRCMELIGRTSYSFYYACLFLLLTPKTILRQAIVWTSGFSNYCTSVALMLVFLVFCIRNTEPEGKRAKILYTAGLLVLGFANSLIVEHITVFSVMLAFGLCIYSFVTDKKNLVQYAGYFIGAAAGAALMFSNSVYHSISEGDDFYRSMPGSGPLMNRIYDNYIYSIHYDGFFNNTLLNASLLLIAILLYKKVGKSESVRPGQRKCLITCLFVFGIFVAYSTFACVTIVQEDLPKAFVLFNAVFAFAALAAFLTYILLTGYLLNDFRRPLILSVSIILVIAPLFAVTPIGSRCYFASYTFFITMGCTMLDYMIGEEGLASSLPAVVLRTAVLSLFIVLLSIFATISAANTERFRMARDAAAKGEKEVIFTVLPFDSFLWVATPAEGLWADRYKLFYGLPEELEIIVVGRDVVERY